MTNAMKSEKGIALITLVITVLILIIITTILAKNSYTTMQLSNLTKLENDINALDNRIAAYYVQNNKLPVYNGDSLTKAAVKTQIKDVSVNDGDIYYTINIEELENLSLNYGSGYRSLNSDRYIVNEETHAIYYLKGVSYDGKQYHTTGQKGLIQGSPGNANRPINDAKTAEVNGKYYKSIGEAVASITSGTINLRKNTSEMITIPAGKSITINLNGKTITGSIVNKGTLIVNGAGTISSTGIALISDTTGKTSLTDCDVVGDIRANAGSITDVKTGDGEYTISIWGVPSEAKYVRFPTWTSKDGQDDLIWHLVWTPVTINGTPCYRYTVKKSEHKEETGAYITHIYWFDQSEKSHMIADRVVSMK